MKKPKVLILRAAGTNCDAETALAFSLLGVGAERVHVNEFLKGRDSFLQYDVLVLPGGFSYGDDVGAGKILANELRSLPDFKVFVDSDRPVIGICNGFQVLVKTGFLPESEGGRQAATLTFNDSGKFEARWVKLKINRDSPCLFTQGLPEVIELPIAHGEGKFVVESEGVLRGMKEKRQVAIQYEGGNPNGSVEDIAGITNAKGNCLGLMPHPERFLTSWHHPSRKGDPVGLEFFRNALDYVKS
ncbi:MAG: phosphoribosylformylglycinamidine synthase I [Elusimicrobia bacterium]|nr:phosphoribosylformylglycinamidine synthase I [Elusimicrobiota bacterium]